VEFIVTAWLVENGNWKKEAVGGAHPCSPEDLKKFYPRATESKK
jgi:hypothetical protein